MEEDIEEVNELLAALPRLAIWAPRRDWLGADIFEQEVTVCL